MYRNLINKLLTTLVVLISSISIVAQNDTIVVEILPTQGLTELHHRPDSIFIESQTATDSYYKLKYEYLDMLLRDETRLFKLAISPFKPNEKYDFSIILSQLGYERKINATFSGIAELNQELMLLNQGNIFINSFDVGFRAYISKEKQIDRGVSGDNCNGIYIGAKASGIIQGITQFSKTGNDRYVSFNPMPELNIGIQQRISNLFYVDATTFVNYNFSSSEAGFGIKLLIGLAIDTGE